MGPPPEVLPQSISALTLQWGALLSVLSPVESFRPVLRGIERGVMVTDSDSSSPVAPPTHLPRDVGLSTGDVVQACCGEGNFSARWQSRLFTVTKKDEDRLWEILDLHVLNTFNKCPHFKMLTIREVKLLLP